jgi:hypothetical protein
VARAFGERVEHQVADSTALRAWRRGAKPVAPRGVPAATRRPTKGRTTGRAEWTAPPLGPGPEFRVIPEGAVVMGEVLSEMVDGMPVVISMTHIILCNFQ